MAASQEARDRALAKRVERIRAHAGSFTLVAALALIVAVVAFLWEILAVLGGETGGALGICEAALATSMWCYLIAQIIHIRANTEK